MSDDLILAARGDRLFKVGSDWSDVSMTPGKQVIYYPPDNDEWAWAGGLVAGLILGFIIGTLLMVVLLA